MVVVHIKCFVVIPSAVPQFYAGLRAPGLNCHVSISIETTFLASSIPR